MASLSIGTVMRPAGDVSIKSISGILQRRQKLVVRSHAKRQHAVGCDAGQQARHQHVAPEGADRADPQRQGSLLAGPDMVFDPPRCSPAPGRSYPASADRPA